MKSWNWLKLRAFFSPSPAIYTKTHKIRKRNKYYQTVIMSERNNENDDGLKDCESTWTWLTLEPWLFSLPKLSCIVHFLWWTFRKVSPRIFLIIDTILVTIILLLFISLQDWKARLKLPPTDTRYKTEVKSFNDMLVCVLLSCSFYVLGYI